ncbi:MAG: cupin domain-containing protein [Bacteroidetes bacterium]|nr:MAG: cupin domain-containing protein [Bacteroidota bacterium]
MNERVKELIDILELQPHPEGGFYKETYRSNQVLENNRNLMTSIYFLITGQNISRLHRIKSDELWYFHEGSTLNIHTLDHNGYRCIKLGRENNNDVRSFALVSGNTIFGSNLENESEENYALVSCAVAPGFDFRDFELFTADDLLKEYPEHEKIIRKLT